MITFIFYFFKSKELMCKSRHYIIIEVLATFAIEQFKHVEQKYNLFVGQEWIQC